MIPISVMFRYKVYTIMEPYNCLSWLQHLPAEQRKQINMNTIAPHFSILCLNITGDANLGNMIRTACLMGCKTFYIAGRKAWDKRYSVGAHHYINVCYLPDVYNTTINTHHSIDCSCGECKKVNIDNLVSFLQEKQLRPVFIEQGGMSILDKTWRVNHHDTQPIFIYGNESNGIPSVVIKQVKAALPDTSIVSVPQLGIMRSHNVATTCTLVLWEYARSDLVSTTMT